MALEKIFRRKTKSRSEQEAEDLKAEMEETIRKLQMFTQDLKAETERSPLADPERG